MLSQAIAYIAYSSVLGSELTRFVRNFFLVPLRITTAPSLSFGFSDNMDASSKGIQSEEEC